MTKMRTRIGSIVLVVAMLLTLLPMNAFADEVKTPNNEMGISYSFEQALREALGEKAPDDTDELTIANCQKLTGKLDLSSKGITEISSGAIEYTKKENLPEDEQSRCVGSVWAVSKLARALNNVTELNLSGNTFSLVPANFLLGSPSITKVILPESVEVIGLTAGSGTYTAQDGTTYSYGRDAFSHMKALESINFSELTNLEYIGDHSFSADINLNLNVQDLPGSLKVIARKAFGMIDAVNAGETFTSKITGDLAGFLEKTGYDKDDATDPGENPDYVWLTEHCFELTSVTAKAEDIANYKYSYTGGVGHLANDGGVTGELVVPEWVDSISDWAFGGWAITSISIPNTTNVSTYTLNPSSDLTNGNSSLTTIEIRAVAEHADEVKYTADKIPAGLKDQITVEQTIGSTYALKQAIAAADNGDTIEIPAGTYDIGTLTITKAVSLKGAGADKTVLNGKIRYAAKATATDSDNSITIEGVKMVATEDANDKAIRWSYRQDSNNTGELENYILNVKDCVIEGYQCGTSLDTNAKNCQLNVTGTTFDTGCAISTKEGNKVTSYEGTQQSGYAVQYFSNDYSVNGYYYDYADFAEDQAADSYDPDVNAADETIVFNTQQLLDAITKAQPGETITLAAGNYDVGSGLQITKRVNLVGENGAVIVGPVQYMFSEDQEYATVTVENLTIRANTSDVQGLQFCGNKPNNGYNVKIQVKDCVFEGWTYGATMNSHANGYNMTVSGCDFTDSLYAVSYNYDTTTDNQIANNSLAFGEDNKIASYGFAVQKFSNDVTANYDDKTYQTIESFVNDEPTIEGSVAYVKTAEELKTTIATAEDDTTIILAPGDYGTDNILFGSKTLTIKAQYPAYVNGQKTEDSKLSKFGGTFNTYGTASDSFNENQKIVIEGIGFYGNGLKVGNGNYNSVGNLEVRYCTMTFGQNLTSENVAYYNQANQFVKINGVPGTPYASVVVENNYVSGTPVANVYPIQLWDVDNAVVRNNKMDLSNAADHQAIGVSKMATDATVEISGNVISGAGGGIYVTTWLLGGNNADTKETFTGTITVQGNQLTCAESNTMFPVYIGYENSNAPYGLLGGVQMVSGNTNKGSTVDAKIVRGPESTPITSITATFKDGNTVVGNISGVPGADGKLTITTLPALSNNGYYTFAGWSNGSTTYSAGKSVTITKDTTFTAVWNYNGPTGGGSSSSGDYLVNVNKVTGGKITVTPGRADKGDTVTITVKPNDGYELDTLVVTDKNGNTVKLTNKGNGKYTFTMPGSQVTVNASFAKDSSSPVDSFLDVNTGAWYYDAVKYAVENGLMSGTGTYTFEPNTTLSRGMIAQMLYALEGKPSISSANNFTDVSSSDWYDKAASWAQSKGIITGYEDGRFGPNDPLTREQLALILVQLRQERGLWHQRQGRSEQVCRRHFHFPLGSAGYVLGGRRGSAVRQRCEHALSHRHRYPR